MEQGQLGFRLVEVCIELIPFEADVVQEAIKARLNSQVSDRILLLALPRIR